MNFYKNKSMSNIPLIHCNTGLESIQKTGHLKCIGANPKAFSRCQPAKSSTGLPTVADVEAALYFSRPYH